MCWTFITELISRLFSSAPSKPTETYEMSSPSLTPDSYAGWTIVHRVLADYHAQFPGWAAKVSAELAAALPGAVVKHELFQRSAEEPFVIPPEHTNEAEVERVRSLARTVCEGAASTTFTGGPQPQPRSNAPEEVAADPRDPNTISGSWLVIVPMFQLEIMDKAPINGRWQVGDVTFLSRTQLATTLAPPTLTNIPRPDVWQRITGNDNCFATISLVGEPQALRRSVFFRLREAASILASTAAFYGRRHHVCGFTLKGYPSFTAKNDRFIQTDGTAFCGNWNQRGFLHPFTLDAQWHTAITQTGIIRLFDRINDTTLPPDWRRQISSGAAMLGRSMMSLELADAFLLNVIGLETLLTRQGERNGRRLFQRIKGMTGWHLRTARPTYQTEIQNIHGVRCEIVHDSDYSNLTTELLLQSDTYLANSLLNIVNLPAVFPDKATLAATLDGYAANENWPTDGSVPFRWFGNATFSPQDLELPLW